MIIYYNKNCFEVAIRKSRANQLLKALAVLRKKYASRLHSTLAQLPGGSQLAVSHRQQQLKTWFESKIRMPDPVLDILTSQTSDDIIFIIQLKAIDNLQSDFGKRYHGKGIGYLSTFVFSSRTDASSEVKKFHSVLGNALKTAFKLKKSPALSSISRINKQFDALKKKRNTTDPIPEPLLHALELLKESDFRNIVSRAKQAKDPTLENIITSSGIVEKSARPLLQKAVDSNILVRQYKVTCPSCGTALARVPVHPRGKYALEELLFPAKSRAKLRLMVHIPKEACKNEYEVYVRQLFDGEEVGRVTWRLVPPERRKKPVGKQKTKR